MIVFGIGALALLGVIALFQVVLEPPDRIPCSSELAPGTFRETLRARPPRRRRGPIGCLYIPSPSAWLSGVSLFCF